MIVEKNEVIEIMIGIGNILIIEIGWEKKRGLLDRWLGEIVKQIIKVEILQEVIYIQSEILRRMVEEINLD